MPEVGLEPTCPCERQILSLVRIPISPPRRELKMIKLLAASRQMIAALIASETGNS